MVETSGRTSVPNSKLGTPGNDLFLVFFFFPPSVPDDEDGEPLEEDQQMLALMEQMDRELASTEIGKSFEKEPETSERTKVCVNIMGPDVA